MFDFKTIGLLVYRIVTALSRYISYREKLYHCSTNSSL